MVEESSGESAGTATFAADGDLTTLWEASTDSNVWVTLDHGDTREVTALRVQVGTHSQSAKERQLCVQTHLLFAIEKE